MREGCASRVRGTPTHVDSKINLKWYFVSWKKLNVDVALFAPYIPHIDLLLAELVYGVISTAF
jgi:hypothetical protein